MEIRRVLLSKKIIISLALLLVISVGFYLGAQYDNAKLNGVSLSQERTEYKNILDALKGKSLDEMMTAINAEQERISVLSDLLKSESTPEESLKIRKEYPELAQEYDENKNSIDLLQLWTKEQELTKISTQVEHISSYSDYLKSIDAQAKQMNTICIFADNDPLSVKNIEKTTEDYASLKGITLSLGNDKPITTVLQFELVHYLTLIFALVIIFSFLEERKKGLQNIIYSAPNGRFSLALKRGAILFFSIAFVNIITYAVMFGVSFLMYGGIDDIFRNVQSVKMLQNFIYPMSELEFILFYILINILTQLTVAFILWFVLSFIQNLSLALGTTAAVFAVEYLLYALLPSQSNIALFKYMNIFYYLNPTEVIIKYRNINAFVIVINAYWLLVISSLVFLAVFAVLCTVTYAVKYPSKTPNKLEIIIVKAFKKINEAYWKLVEKLNVTGIELYKLLVIQKGFVVLAAFVLVLFSLTSSNPIFYSAEDSILNRFYEQYGGKVGDGALNYVADIEAELEAADKEYIQASKDYSNGRLSKNDYEMARLRYSVYDTKRSVLSTIYERLDYIENNAKNGNEAWLVNPKGYENLLYTSGYSRQQSFSLLSVFSIVIIISGVFAFEKRSQMYNSLMASFGGRGQLFKKKILSATIITVIIWLCFTCAELYDVFSQYTLANPDAPIKSLEVFNSLPFNISIGAFIALMYITRLILLLSSAYIVCFISSCTKYHLSIITSLAVLILPSVLYTVGIEAFSYASVTVPIAFMNLLISSQGFTFLIPVFFITVLGILSIIFAKQKWCKNSR
ncbi:MAG: hypothetical protein ACI4I4_06295 [Acutalibacteraceae bacterium]